MAQKAWIITLEAAEQKTKILDVVNARRKIEQLNAYLCTVYNALFARDGLDKDAVRKAITHHSGSDLSVTRGAYVLRAQLAEIEAPVYTDSEISELVWRGLGFQRSKIDPVKIAAEIT